MPSLLDAFWRLSSGPLHWCILISMQNFCKKRMYLSCLSRRTYFSTNCKISCTTISNLRTLSVLMQISQ